MEQEKTKYSIEVDKSLVTQFFRHPVSDTKPEEVREIKKVFEIVFHLYFRKYHHYKEEFKSACVEAVIMRHPDNNQNFDSSRPQFYNYVFTLFRNEICNRSRKLKEDPSDEFPVLSESQGDAHYFEGLDDFLPYLAGNKDFFIIEVPQNLILRLLTFVEEHLNKLSESDSYFSVASLLINTNYE